ncbi:GNAT family N-acetyltransferase [Cucumibacter marinus]|uniref:GNAT family N-acetyltransferase n=1 Tax=Cucumibacter marinus TaxID=1121252 RepID=UPI00041C3E54|nr:GNAT family N-acetyltransferase [Cucumibacter marinus]
MHISYAVEPDLSLDEFMSVVTRSTLGERRPYKDDPERAQRILDASDLMVTARDENGTLLGIARCITDFDYCLYCSDLGVVPEAQGHGLGKGLLAAVKDLAPGCKNYLLISAPGAVSFYEQAGYTRHDHCFLF